MSTSPVYTISELAKKFMSPSQLQRAKEHVAELNRQTPEERAADRTQQEQEAREAERECKKLEQQAWKKWRGSEDFGRLASKLGVGGVFAATSTIGVFGQYVAAADALDNWRLSKVHKTRLARAVVRNIPIILIDVPGSIFGRTVRDVIAHEIGHHIDHVANPDPEFDSKIATKKFHAAFEDAGLWRNGSDGDAYSEHIAETLGAYLRGLQLNRVLMAEVRKVLAKLPRSKAKLINEFRRTQIRRVEIAA